MLFRERHFYYTEGALLIASGKLKLLFMEISRLRAEIIAGMFPLCGKVINSWIKSQKSIKVMDYREPSMNELELMLRKIRPN